VINARVPHPAIPAGFSGLWPCRSPLPEDPSRFQGNSHAVVMRNDSHRVVCRRASGGHGTPEEIAADRSHKLPDTCRFPPYRIASRRALRVKFDPNGVRIEFTNVNLNVKDVLIAARFHLHFTELDRQPHCLVRPSRWAEPHST
jgi:hypothetical protein